jgi:hypothetical protein
LAVALGIRYRSLPDKGFNHSEVIALADSDGIIRAQAVGVQGVDESFLEKIRSLSATTTAIRQDGG